MKSRNATTRRNAQLAAIHVAKKQLGLDDDTYRAMLWAVARVESAADLDGYGRAQVLDHLKARGFRSSSRGRGGHTRLPAERRGLRGKIDALLGERPAAYGDALAKRICKVERLDWCNPEQLRKIVAALSYDAKRKANRG